MPADERQVCQACGTAAAPGSQFCERCGVKLDAPMPVSEPPTPSESNAQVQPAAAEQVQQTAAPQTQSTYEGQAVPVMRIAKRRSKTPVVLLVIGVGLLALIIGTGIGFVTGWSGYKPAKLSQKRAAQIASELSSDNANEYADAAVLPKQAVVTSDVLALQSKESYDLDTSSFHFINNKLGWVKVTVKTSDGVTVNLGMCLGYVDGKWKLMPNFLLASS